MRRLFDKPPACGFVSRLWLGMGWDRRNQAGRRPVPERTGRPTAPAVPDRGEKWSLRASGKLRSSDCNGMPAASRAGRPDRGKKRSLRANGKLRSSDCDGAERSRYSG